MSENIQPTSEENKIVEDFEKEKLSENSFRANVEQPTLNLEQNRFECRSCGYIYDPSEGNKKLNIPKNTPFRLTLSRFSIIPFIYKSIFDQVFRSNTAVRTKSIYIFQPFQKRACSIYFFGGILL